MKKTIYITTTLPYVNAKPHIGHAREFVQADVLARYHRLLGDEVFFNTGTDEHGQKVYERAIEEKKDPQGYVDEQVQHFLELCKCMNIEFSRFIRTTDRDHIEAAQRFWQIVDEKGYIYKKNYCVKYCVGCELEKTDSELVDGKCPDHPNKELEIREEENYFFRFSSFQKKLSSLYEKDPDFVKPQKRFNEIKAFTEKGLEDFSISRLREKMPWGVEVPGDPEHVMYVWFDALVNYISTLGWPKSDEQFKRFWGTVGDSRAVQLCGKDNLRQQSAMWQAMLMAADLPNSKKVFVNGFIISGGQKMSKTIGNVISPIEMIDRYGVDATRYLLLSMGSFGEDTDMTWERLDEKYNADLANGLGNLVSRIVKLYGKIEKIFDVKKSESSFFEKDNIRTCFSDGKMEAVLFEILAKCKSLDERLEEVKPWMLAKDDIGAFEREMEYFVKEVYDLGCQTSPFMPEISEKIKKAIERKETEPLFARI